MIVELTETSPNTWGWFDSIGNRWDVMLTADAKPVEAKCNKVKSVIKLKEAGFTAEEIIEMSKEDVV